LRKSPTDDAIVEESSMSEQQSQAAAEAAVYAIVRFDAFHEPRTDANVHVHAVVRDERRAAREVARLNRAHAGRGALFVWQPVRME
jgi:hypothetical protein